MSANPDAERGETPGEARLPRLPMALLAFALFAMAVSNSFVFAVLPPIARDLGLSEVRTALVVAPAALVFVVANGIWGLLIDRIAPRRAIVAAVGAAAVATAAFGWIVAARFDGALSAAGTFYLLMATRLCLGALSGGLLPAAQSLVARLTVAALRTRAMAAIGAGFALGMVAGPGVAAALSGFGATVPFFGVAALAAAATLAVAAGLGRPRTGGPSGIQAQGRTPLQRLAPLLAIVVLVYTSYGILLQVTGFRMRDAFGLGAGDAAAWTGIALMAAAAGLVVAQITIARARLSARHGATVLLLGAAIALGAMALSAVTAGLAMALAGAGLFGIGAGMALPAALALLTMAADAAGDQGRVGGFSGAAQGLGLVFGPLAGAAAYRFAPATPYLLGAALLAVAILLGFAAATGRPLPFPLGSNSR
jgi:MFS family permease